MINTQNGHLLGYARVSTNDQEWNLQVDALIAHGVTKERLFFDKISGAREDRPGLQACNEALRRGDTLVVWRLDRLRRSMRHLVNPIEDLKERGIGFRSISDGMIDTTSASGELLFNIFSALAQFERRLIQERTNAGLAAARALGRRGGRPPMNRDHPCYLPRHSGFHLASSRHLGREVASRVITWRIGLAAETELRVPRLELQTVRHERDTVGASVQMSRSAAG